MGQLGLIKKEPYTEPILEVSTDRPDIIVDFR